LSKNEQEEAIRLAVQAAVAKERAERDAEIARLTAENQR
jgi:hypothetical protein